MFHVQIMVIYYLFLQIYLFKSSIFFKFIYLKIASEIIEWTGFAIACWSISASGFAIMTFCNLGPRASHVSLFYIYFTLIFFNLIYFNFLIFKIKAS